MEPVEINAGTYYLRQLRADDLLDDRPALVEALADDLAASPGAAGEYIARRGAQWDRGERCSWAVAEPTTGALLGEVGLTELDLDAGTAQATVWTHPAARGKGVARTALDAVLRFGFGALGLRSVGYRHDPADEAAAAVARRCGFHREGEAGAELRWRLAVDPA